MHPAENRGDVDGEIRAAVIVGNPKPDSRTLRAAQLVAQQLAHVPPVLVADLAKLGAELLGPDSEPVASLVRTLQEVDLLVVASPTYKGTFSGLLKLFLDQIAADALSAVVVIPLMLGAGPGHALAPEVSQARFIGRPGGHGGVHDFLRNKTCSNFASAGRRKSVHSI